MKRILYFKFILFVIVNHVFAQSDGVYYKLENALQQPEDARELVLINQKMEQLPASIGKLKHLEKLNLSGNHLKELPKEITSLPLTELNLSGNTELNIGLAFEKISQITSLRKLWLKNCDLYYLPYKAGKLAALEELNLSGNHIQSLPAELRNLVMLQFLNLANNEITLLSEEFIYLEQLKSLNISYNPGMDLQSSLQNLSSLPQLEKVYLNGISYLPSSISGLDQIKYLDLSHSHIEEIPGQFSKLNSLETLVLKYCSGFKYEILFSKLSVIKSLHTLIIYDDELKSCPNGLGRLNSLETIKLKGNELEFLSPDFQDLTRLKKLSIILSPKINTEELFRSIYKIESLATLELRYNNLGFLPSNIEELAYILTFDLKGNNLTSIPHGITKTQVALMNIQDNPIEALTIADLKEKLPECLILHDPVRETLETKTIKRHIAPPFSSPNLQIGYEKFTMDASSGREITTKNGSSIAIPSAAFVDQNGNPVTGKVDIRYREFNDPVEIFLSGVPMNYDENGKTYFFESAGMFEFRAYQNDAPLFPNPKERITVGLKSKDADTSKNMYYYDEETNNWMSFGKSDVNEISLGTQESMPSFNTNISKPQKPNHIKYEYVYFKFFTPFSSRNFKFKVKGSTRFYRSKPSYINYYKWYPEFKILRTVKWNYDGKDAKKDFKTFKHVVKKSKKEKRYMFKDIRLITNPEGDNYIFRFVYKLDTFNIPVFIDMKTRNPEMIQKKNKRFYTKYKALLDIREAQWKQVDATYEADQLAYQKELEAYKKALDNMNVKERVAPSWYYRNTYLNSFGYWNIDVKKRMEKPETILAKFCTDDSSSMEVKSVYILDCTAMGSLEFHDTELMYDAASENILLTILDNHTLGYAKAKEFEEATGRPGYKKIFKLEILDTDRLNTAEFRYRLGF